MTEFKIGDRLRGTATYSGLPNGEAYEGVFRGEHVAHGILDSWPKVHAHDESEFYLDISKPITVVSTLDFVGPRPEPVPEPRLLLPFQTYGNVVQDARGYYVLEVSASGTSSDQDEALAVLVTELLNNHFEKG